MGLTNWTGGAISKSETAVAKNYLTPDELNLLNRIVTAYLEFAELQASNRNPMYMRDWISKLDDFLKLSGKDLLTNGGQISHKLATEKADQEYAKFHENMLDEPSQVEKDFIAADEELLKIARRKRQTGN